MKSKPSTLGFVLMLSALIVSACGPFIAQEPIEVSPKVREARNAVLAYVGQRYGEEVPPPDTAWKEENITPGWPEAPVPGWVEYKFTAQDWVVTVGHAVLPPERIVYQVAVANQTTRFQWQGEVDATGQVADRLAPEEVRAARDAALAYVIEYYSEQAPVPGLTWREERTTPEGLVGLETFEFTAGDWVVTISYPVVAPEAVVYQVVVANQATGFQWEGEVDAAGQVTELSASTEPTVDIRDPGQALDIALAYINEHYGEQAPAPGLAWTGNQPPPEEPVGGETIEFTSESAPDWVVTVSYGVVAPEAVVYHVAVTNQTTGFRWEGEVDATGQVTELSAPTAGQPVACWYGCVESTPDDPPYDDYLVLLPEELRRAVGVAGADEAVEAEIEGLRDSGTYAHFWGTLACDMPDYGGCQLVVTRLRAEGPGGPFFDPDPVEDWTGTIFSTPDDAQFDDYFVLAGNFPVRYGIDSLDSTIAAQLESLRDTGATIRVWGQVTCPAIDFYGTQIQVTRIEVAREAPAEEEGYEGWNTYTSEKFGYTLRYPGDATVMGANPDESVQFVGPIVNNEHWPWFFVDHYDSDFYHPPAGADVHQWLADSDMPCDEIGSEVEVAGLPTVHLIYEASPQAYARDDYYFIRGDQLFRISILHASGQQDWNLYDKFLQSFTFLGRAASFLYPNANARS